MKTFEYTIKDELGIHARPAGLLVKAAKAYASEVSLTKGDKTVSCTKLKATIITPVFKDWKNGQYKMISFYAKKARGLMSRYIIDQQITTAEKLKEFDVEGYRFSAEMSQENEWVFLRDHS